MMSAGLANKPSFCAVANISLKYGWLPCLPIAFLDSYLSPISDRQGDNTGGHDARLNENEIGCFGAQLLGQEVAEDVVLR
jgi:hypothetical protein